MKRSIHILITIFLLLAFLPVCASAETYNLNETDISVNIDDSLWWVFTRDNLKNNPKMDELGLQYDEMYKSLCDNFAYMDAILFRDDGTGIELFIRKKVIDSGIVNLSNYDEAELLTLAKALAERQKSENYSIYGNEYKFIKSEYIDSNLGFYIYEFVTYVNKDNYTLTFQSATPFSDLEYEEMNKIVDSVQFDVDTSLKENKITLKENDPYSFWSNVITNTVIGAIAGGIIGAIISLLSKRKKKDSKNQENSSNDPEMK